jgi:hypothetical protein
MKSTRVWNLHEEILQGIGTALSTPKQQLCNSSDIPDMLYLNNLSANSSGKKTTLYFNQIFTGFQNKTTLIFLTVQMKNVCNPHGRYKFYSSNMMCKLNEELSHIKRFQETNRNWPPDLSVNIRKAPDNQLDFTEPSVLQKANSLSRTLPNFLGLMSESRYSHQNL